MAAIRDQPSPTRHQYLVRRSLFAALGLAIITMTALMHGFAWFEHKPVAYVVVGALCVGALAGVATWLVGRFGSSTLGPRRVALARFTRVALPALAVGSLAANVAAPETMGWPSRSVTCHVACTVVLLLSGAMLAAFAVLSLRRADPISPRTTATAIGALAGAWASLAVGLQCPYPDPIHVLATHVAPVAVLMWLTARLGARFVGLDPLPPPSADATANR
jgi:hypothetical protein